MAEESRREIIGSARNADEEAGDVEDELGEGGGSGPESIGRAMELYLILYPKEREETIIQTLEAIGVPGYTEFPKLIGRGRRVRHFDNPIWPGATGAVFTVISSEQAPALVGPFRRLNRDLEARSHGAGGLHMFALPCRQII
jgi:hypothetical protein